MLEILDQDALRQKIDAAVLEAVRLAAMCGNCRECLDDEAAIWQYAVLHRKGIVPDLTVIHQCLERMQIAAGTGRYPR